VDFFGAGSASGPWAFAVWGFDTDIDGDGGTGVAVFSACASSVFPDGTVADFELAVSTIRSAILAPCAGSSGAGVAFAEIALAGFSAFAG